MADHITEEQVTTEGKKEDKDRTTQLNRRTFLTIGAIAGAAGIAASGCNGMGGMSGYSGAGPADPESVAADLQDNVFTRLLGVRPHIGTHGHLSSMGGSRMPPEVMEAMTEANRFFVDMSDLHVAAGRRIAEVMGAEDALVTSGGFAALVLGAAAALAGTDEDRRDALPKPTWPKVECLFQTPHRFFYDNAFHQAGMEIVEADSKADFEAAITDRTALIVGLAVIERQNTPRPPFPARHREERSTETLMPDEIIEIGNRKGVPVMIDMASELPPTRNLTRFTEAGADLVVVSGGKGIHGPNSTGILAGRRDLIESARMQNSPNNGIGRGFKVGKEEVIGLIAALEWYIGLDEDELISGWNQKAQWLAEQLQGIPGLDARYELNTSGYGDVELVWDEDIIPLSREDVGNALKAGDPSIIYYGVTIRTGQLENGEEVLVANRLRELFTTGS